MCYVVVSEECLTKPNNNINVQINLFINKCKTKQTKTNNNHAAVHAENQDVN